MSARGGCPSFEIAHWAKAVRLAAWFGAVLILVGDLSRAVRAQSLEETHDLDDTLKPYAVGIVKTKIFQSWTGYGIYLGRGLVITAAHVVGGWPSLTRPRVLVADQELPVTIIKEGSVEGIDLALLSVSESSLPLSLALRRNHLCKEPPFVGANVVVVDLRGTARSKIVSPRVVPVQYRARYNTVVADLPVVGQSGSGVFLAEKNCLMGIITSAIRGYQYQQRDIGAVGRVVNVAKYFIPAATIADFVPPQFRF